MFPSNNNISRDTRELMKGNKYMSQAAIVHLNLRAGSTFPVPVSTVPHGHWVKKADNQQD